MTPQLSDFLTRLLSTRQTMEPMPVSAERSVEWFYRYLHESGIEHCNFGGFEIDDRGKGDMGEFSGSTLPEPFIDEFTAEMSADDYVLLKANELGPDRPALRFGIGEPHLAEIETFNPRSRVVSQECARHGIADGFAMIGNAPIAPGAARSRFYGFVFANADPRDGVVVQRRADELQIAAFALLDRIMPTLHATIDGFGYDLTMRERDVLAQVAGGAHRKLIAHRFDISIPTVDAHLANLRRKLQAQTLAEAVAKAYLYGIL